MEEIQAQTNGSGLARLSDEAKALATSHMLLASWYVTCQLGIRRPGPGQEELIQQAALGVMRAAQDYDPASSKFSTYAGWWMRHFTTRWMQQHRADVRLPVRCEQARAASRRAGDAPAHDGVALVQRLSLHAAGRESVSTLEDFIPDDAPGPEHTAASSQVSERVRDALGRIPARLAAILRRRCGIDCGEETLEEIAADMRISRERVRQLEAQGLSRLRDEIEPEDVDWVPVSKPQLRVGYERLRLGRARMPDGPEGRVVADAVALERARLADLERERTESRARLARLRRQAEAAPRRPRGRPPKQPRDALDEAAMNGP